MFYTCSSICFTVTIRPPEAVCHLFSGLMPALFREELPVSAEDTEHC